MRFINFLIEREFFHHKQITDALNDFVTKNVLMKSKHWPNDNMFWPGTDRFEFVKVNKWPNIGNMMPGSRQRISFYYKGLPPEDTHKAIAATKYYLQELGVPLLSTQQGRDRGTIEFTVKWRPNNGRYPELAQWDDPSAKNVKFGLDTPEQHRSAMAQFAIKNSPNLAMKKKLENGEAIDVRRIGHEIEPGVFKLDHYIDNIDYCDPQKRAWIYSIAKNKETGEIRASYNSIDDDDWEEIWRR